VVGLRCWEGMFSVDLCERGMPVWEIIGDLAFCSTEFSG
jgi:hypothetical protein